MPSGTPSVTATCGKEDACSGWTGCSRWRGSMSRSSSHQASIPPRGCWGRLRRCRRTAGPLRCCWRRRRKKRAGNSRRWAFRSKRRPRESLCAPRPPTSRGWRGCWQVSPSPSWCARRPSCAHRYGAWPPRSQRSRIVPKALSFSLPAHRVRVPAPLQQPAGDDRTLYLARALPDAVDPELAVVTLGRVLGHVPAAAEDLDRTVGDPAGHLGGEQLGHRRLPVQDVWGVVVPHAGHVVHHQPGGVQLGRRVGQHELYRLVLGDLLSRRLTLQRPRPGQVYEPLGGPATTRGYHQPLRREPALGPLVSPGSEARVLGDPTIFQPELDVLGGVRVVHEDRRSHELQPRRLALHEERSLLLAGPRQHDKEAGPLAASHEPLLPVQDPFVPVSCGSGLDVLYVRAGFGLGDGPGLPRLATQDGHDVALHLLGTCQLEELSRSPVGDHVPEAVGHLPRLLLERHQRDHGEVHPAILRWHVEVAEPGLARLLAQRPQSLLVDLAACGDLRFERMKLFPHELGDAPLQRLYFFRNLGRHLWRRGHSSISSSTSWGREGRWCPPPCRGPAPARTARALCPPRADLRPCPQRRARPSSPRAPVPTSSRAHRPSGRRNPP